MAAEAIQQTQQNRENARRRLPWILAILGIALVIILIFWIRVVGGPAAFWDKTSAKYFVAFLILAITTFGLHLGTKYVYKRFVPEGESPGLWSLVVGEDKRGSTSKLQVLLWTYAIVFALLSILFNSGIDGSSKMDCSLSISATSRLARGGRGAVQVLHSH